MDVHSIALHLGIGRLVCQVAASRDVCPSVIVDHILEQLTPPPDPPVEPLPCSTACAVFDHLLAGESEKQIARRLGLSPHTVHSHVKALYRRYGVSSRAELMARWVRR